MPIQNRRTPVTISRQKPNAVVSRVRTARRNGRHRILSLPAAALDRVLKKSPDTLHATIENLKLVARSGREFEGPADVRSNGKVIQYRGSRRRPVCLVPSWILSYPPTDGVARDSPAALRVFLDPSTCSPWPCLGSLSAWRGIAIAF